MFIDTHAHLDYPDVKKDLPDILARAQDNGVDKVIVPATSYTSSLDIAELVQKYDMLYGAAGIHPTEISDFKEIQLTEIENLSKLNKIVAIGEIGLDYFWEPYDKELEKFVLKEQLKIAKRNNLPVILHNRNSSNDLIEIVEEEYDGGNLKCQFHSFSGNLGMAKRCIELGFYISFTGNITYKPNEQTIIAYEIVKELPLNNMLLETDSPYLTPVPHRGKKNEPSYIKYTAQKLADLKQLDVYILAEQTTRNAEKLFNI